MNQCASLTQQNLGLVAHRALTQASSNQTSYLTYGAAHRRRVLRSNPNPNPNPNSNPNPNPNSNPNPNRTLTGG
ncbi:hypothetical protein GY45DRAFT_1376220 [Cubamyces sp. BRFM 1775]|nr:hypothetical protein GY45DRAFT_1376220 [Cubamyces sp. BRFM 1775]